MGHALLKNAILHLQTAIGRIFFRLSVPHFEIFRLDMRVFKPKFTVASGQHILTEIISYSIDTFSVFPTFFVGSFDQILLAMRQESEGFSSHF